MVAKIKIKTNFRRRAVKKAMDKANFTSLGRAGAFVRTIMMNSIKKRNKPKKRVGGRKRKLLKSEQPSTPGSPPKTEAPARKLRKAILFELSPQKDDVAIGPTFGGFGKIGAIHEEGKTVVGKQFFNAPDGRRRSKKVLRTYPKRPFAKPALDKSTPRLPKLWANSVKS